MSAVHEVKLDGTTWTDISSRILREGWEVKEAAEEGSVPIVTIPISDPAMNFEVVGHREYRIRETESEADDDVLYHGYTAVQRVSRGVDAEGQFEPLGRVWHVDVSDTNTVWARRVMEGTDCNRPAETDVERMQWLLATAEAGAFDNITDFVYTTNPVAMDAVNYTGQMFNNIADDCAQASGKNWFAFYRNVGAGVRELTAWYGDDSEAGYVSPLSLSNDPADWTDAGLADGTSDVWPISEDTELSRDPTRVFSGVHVPYDGGATYVVNTTTGDAFAYRDAIMPSVNVKTKAKAQARGRRWLRDADEQDLRITTVVEVPKAKATKLRAGMAVDFKATHLTDGLDEFTTCRILGASPKPIAAGTRYRVALELGVPRGSSTYGSVYAALYQTHTQRIVGADPNTFPIRFGGTGDDPPSGFEKRPTIGLVTPLSGPGPYPGWLWYGWQMNGTGTIQVKLNAPTVGVLPSGFTTITWYCTVNGSIAAQSQQVLNRDDYNNGYFKVDGLIDATISVADGDVVEFGVIKNRPVAFFYVRGVGDLTQGAEIVAGTLV